MKRHSTLVVCLLAAVVSLAAGPAPAQTVNFTINNQCQQTIYPAIVPPYYQNGGWTMAAGTSVTFPVPSTFSGRVWARKNCNTSVSPYVCDTGSCGGTGASCAGSTGTGNTTLAELTLAGSPTGTDWYNASNVDAYDFPASIAMSNGQGFSPTCTADVLGACPAELQVKNAAGQPVYCSNPCSIFPTPLICCTNLDPQQCRDVVNQWPAVAQQYVNDVHNNCGETYAYPWDDWWGLHTATGGSTTWTITFCPNGVQPGSGAAGQPWPLAPTNIAGTSPGTTASLTWNAVAGATSYRIYRTTTGGASSALPGEPIYGTVTTPSFTDSGLTSGVTYYYIVTAINAAGYSAPSAQLTLKAGAGAGSTIASAPGNLKATPNLGQVALTWTASPNATSYNLYRGTSPTQEATTPIASGITGTSYTNTGLTNGVTYYFLVSGVNGSGIGAPSNEVNATVGNTVYPPGDIAINAGGASVTPFLADAYFSGGAASTSANTIDVSRVTNPAPAAVYQSNRYGNATYTVPGLIAGNGYTVRLHFCETYQTAAGVRKFNVLLNGAQVLTNFDIFAAAGGQNIANVQQFTATANASGQVVIQTVTVSDNAQINGIEVYPTNGVTPTPTATVRATATATATATFTATATTRATATATATATPTPTATTSASTNLALNKPATASSVENAGTGANLAVDGNAGTRWSSAFSDPQWLTVDLGAPTAIGRVRLVWEAAYATAYQIQVSNDNINWSTIRTVTGGTGGTQDWTGLSGSGRYVRMYGTARATGYGYSLWEFEVYGGGGATATATPTSTATATATATVRPRATATATATTGTTAIAVNCGGGAAAPFVADTGFTGGSTYSTTAAIATTGVVAPAPQAVYQSARQGTFTYMLGGLAAGSTHTVRLHFAELYFSATGQRVFNVSVNGAAVLTNFDIVAAAGARNAAVVRSFTATANGSGQIVVATTNGTTDQPMLNGIDIQ
jgi:hypothetical protein